MSAYLIRRLGFALVTLFAVLTIIFVIVRILPGDPALVILGDQADAATVAALRERLGLNRPILAQYGTFLAGALSGDWGVSLVTGRPVIQEVLKVLGWTIELTVASLVIGAVLGVPLGVWAANNRNSWIDYVIRMASLLGLSFPAFVSGILLLIVFAIQLKWFPVISARSGSFTAWIQSLALPALTLGLIMAAYITRVTRSAMLEVLSEDYVRTARAKGAPAGIVVWRHALRNALLPTISVVALNVGWLLSGAVLVENVFAYPGMGRLMLQSISMRDIPVVQAVTLAAAAIYALANLGSDLLYSWLNPKIRYS